MGCLEEGIGSKGVVLEWGVGSWKREEMWGFYLRVYSRFGLEELG